MNKPDLEPDRRVLRSAVAQPTNTNDELANAPGMKFGPPRHFKKLRAGGKQSLVGATERFVIPSLCKRSSTGWTTVIRRVAYPTLDSCRVA